MTTGALLVGSLDADGQLVLSGDTRRSDGCPMRLAIALGTSTGSASVSGGSGFSVSCFGYSSCYATYLGVWTRR